MVNPAAIHTTGPRVPADTGSIGAVGWLGWPVQRWRKLAQVGFFLLFVFAPVLDIFRLDLTVKHFILFGFDWTLGLDDFVAGKIGAGQAALNIIWRGFLPILAVGGTLIWVSWKWGRLYCGWLCPHFSVVETINNTLRRAIGKQSLWDSKPMPERNPDGSSIEYDAIWWLAVLPMVIGFAFLWALVLLTYLLPPATVWGNLLHGTLTPNQGRFIAIASTVLTLEFTFARHLFCRFGCAVGLFQSLAWMANPKGLVVAFDRERARDCRSCSTANSPQGSACDSACPMRLNPRNIKRMMFSCVQCGQCLTECESSHDAQGRSPNLEWKVGLDAVRETLRQRREDRG